MVDLNRREWLASVAALSTLGGCVSAPLSPRRPLLVDAERGPDDVIDLWPDGAPGSTSISFREEIIERTNAFGLRDRAALNITRPTLSLFRASTATGRHLLIIPGGGYARVVIDKEGFEGARYFSRLGYDCYVLKYRLPHPEWETGADTPLADARRAMQIIRARHGRGVCVNLLGFSAGGHLAGLLCDRFGDVSSRPDQAALIYPVVRMRGPHVHKASRENLLGPDASEQALTDYDLSSAPNPDGPAMVLVHAVDDVSVPVENTLDLAAALRTVGRLKAVHIYERGGHGFGFRLDQSLPAMRWPDQAFDQPDGP